MAEVGDVVENLKTENLAVTEAIDYKKILGDKRVLFVADSHTSVDDKKAFKQELPKLAELGITDIALEMLPKGFNTEDVDAVREYFNQHWQKGNNMENEYFDIYSRARELGLHVWGIDISIEEYRAQSQSATFDKRNRQWADEVESHLKASPNAKVAVFHGMGHAGYYPAGGRVNNMLVSRGVDSVVVHHYGGDHNDTFLEEEKMMQRLTQERKDPFMVKVSKPSRSADYMIHIPTS